MNETTTSPEKVNCVKINCGGVIFKCYSKTLQTFEGSVLSKLDHTNEHYDEKENEYFFDRNPLLFQYILDGYRTGSIHVPGDVCGSKIREELEFWGLQERFVSKCCWQALYESDNRVRTVETIENFYAEDSSITDSHINNDLRIKIWRFVHDPKSSEGAKIWGVFISFIICLSVMVSAVETVTAARTGTYTLAANATFHKVFITWKGGDTSLYTTFFLNLYKKPHVAIPVLETFCFIVLTLEVIVVFSTSPNKMSLCKCWLHMSGVLCIVAFWFYFICERNVDSIQAISMIRAMIVCKFLTTLKLVWLFRIAKHITALKVMGLTLWNSMYELFVLGIMLFILTSLFGITMYLSESIDNDTFDNVFYAMYWALITMTTVGYGNYVPSTAVGHVVASACAVCGVIILAIPIGIFASNFNDLYTHHKYVSKYNQSKHRYVSAENIKLI